MPITNQLLELYELVVDPATALLNFTHLRWFRSAEGSDGPFEAMTSAAGGPAVLAGTAAEPHALNGKTLRLRVDGSTEAEVSFAGADPYSTSDVIADILAETALVVASDDGSSRLVLTSASVGTGASIEVLESEGALALGLVTGQYALGTASDEPLVPGTHQYFFTDENGSRDYWYRTQLVNNTTSQVDAQAPAFPGTEVPVVPYALTIPAYVRVIDLRGRPIEGRRVVISNVFLPNVVGNYNVFRHSDSFLTDETGYGELRLVRGSTVDVHVEGTSYTRRITLPGVQDPVDLVNLFDPSLSSEDEFGIQEPDIDFAIRMS